MLVERGEDVEREAQQFERDENDQQVLGADQEHLPTVATRMSRTNSPTCSVKRGIRGHQQRDDGEHEQRDLDKMGERVGEQRSVENIRLRGRENNARDGEDAAERSEKCGDGEAVCVAARAQQQEIDGQARSARRPPR